LEKIFREFGENNYAIEIFDYILNKNKKFITASNLVSFLKGSKIKAKEVSYIMSELTKNKSFFSISIWKQFSAKERNEIYNFIVKNPEKIDAKVIFFITKEMEKNNIVKLIDILNVKNSIDFYKELASFGLFDTIELIYSLLKAFKRNNNTSSEDTKMLLDTIVSSTKLGEETYKFLIDLIKKIDESNSDENYMQNNIKEINNDEIKFSNETEKICNYYRELEKFDLKKFIETFNSLKTNSEKITLLKSLLKNPNIVYSDLNHFRSVIKKIDDPELNSLLKQKASESEI
jgi:hypothetical protein